MRSLLAALFLAAPAVAKGPVMNPDALVVLLREPWQSLDPAVATDLGSQLIYDNVFESLVAFDKGPDDFRPWLSAEVPSRKNGLLSEDRLVYTFPIRKGVLFHDGSTLTPEDVRYSFLRDIIVGEKNGPPSLLLRPLLGVDSIAGPDGRWSTDPRRLAERIEVKGESVVFHLERPFHGFFKLLAAWPIVTSKSWAAAHGDWDGDLAKLGDSPPEPRPYFSDHAVGTGAFRVESADLKTHEVRLARHDGYWNNKARLKTAVVRSIRSDALRAIMLQNGDADYVYLERPALELLKGSEGITLLDDIPSFESGETFFFTFKIDAKDNARIGSGRLDGKGIPPDFFQDKDLRQGFAYAFNAKTYNRDALAGKGTRAAGPIPQSLLPGPVPENGFEYSPEKAEAAFKRARSGEVWKKGFTLSLGYPRGSIRRHIACELMKAGVERLNPKFKINVEALGARDFMEAYRAHKFPLFIHSWAVDYPGAHSMAFQFFDSDGFFPKAQAFSDPEMDGLERDASHERDAGKRREMYLELERRAREQAIQLYTYHPKQFKAVRSWLKGLDRDQTVNGLSFLNMLYFQPLYKE